MSRLGQNELDYGMYYDMNDTIRRIDAVTGVEVASLARVLLRPRGTGAISVMGPTLMKTTCPMRYAR